MTQDAQIVVIGAGPAGAAAAIHAAQNGCRVLLIEGTRFPRHRPGESLHPGTEPVFKQLGVGSELARVSGNRFSGVQVAWGDTESFNAYGSTGGVPWKGVHIEREMLDAVLLDQARRLGVEVRQPLRSIKPLIHKGRVAGVHTTCGPIAAEVVIDASGRSRWLARHSGLATLKASRRLIARYGYCSGNLERLRHNPRLEGNAGGWVWQAQIAEPKIAWVGLTLWQATPRDFKPRDLDGLPDLGQRHGADVTWTLVEHPAGPGYFIAGDAAAHLDPSSSHGVLRALLSGIMAAHLASSHLAGRISDENSSRAYCEWLVDGWEQDSNALSALYHALNPGWPRFVRRFS